MKNILGICDQDKVYADILSDNLKKRNSFPFEISNFESIDSLLRFVKKGMVKVVLISETMYEELKIKEESFLDNTLKIIILNEGKGFVEEIPTIWKYQSSENIRKEIITCISQNEDLDIKAVKVGKNQTSLIGIYSPVKYRNESAAVYVIGQNLSKKDKTLVISLKEFSELRQILDGKEEKDITDLIYYLRTSSERFIYSLEGMISTSGNMDYIQPAYSFIDLKAAQEEDWINLFNELKKLSTYRYVVIELSEIVNGFLEILRKCDIIISFCNEDRIVGNLLNNYKTLLEELEYEDVTDKTNLCTVGLAEMLSVFSKANEIMRSEFAVIVSNEMERIANENGI